MPFLQALSRLMQLFPQALPALQVLQQAFAAYAVPQIGAAAPTVDNEISAIADSSAFILFPLDVPHDRNDAAMQK